MDTISPLSCSFLKTLRSAEQRRRQAVLDVHVDAVEPVLGLDLHVRRDEAICKRLLRCLAIVADHGHLSLARPRPKDRMYFHEFSEMPASLLAVVLSGAQTWWCGGFSCLWSWSTGRSRHLEAAISCERVGKREADHIVARHQRVGDRWPLVAVRALERRRRVRAGPVVADDGSSNGRFFSPLMSTLTAFSALTAASSPRAAGTSEAPGMTTPEPLGRPQQREQQPGLRASASTLHGSFQPCTSSRTMRCRQCCQASL